MQYVVIEYLGEPKLTVTEDGKTAMYDNIDDAKEAARECQNGIIVPLVPTLMDTIAHAYSIIDDVVDQERLKEDDEIIVGELEAIMGYD